MGWLNSSAGSGFFFSLCSATKAIVPCLGPASDAVPPCGLSWPFKPGPIPHPVPFQTVQTATPRGRKLEDLFTYLQIFQFKKDTCQNPAPCFQLDSPLTVGQIASPSEKLICRFWILYLVMSRWRFSFGDIEKTVPALHSYCRMTVSTILGVKWTAFHVSLWACLQRTVPSNMLFSVLNFCLW